MRDVNDFVGCAGYSGVVVHFSATLSTVAGLRRAQCGGRPAQPTALQRVGGLALLAEHGYDDRLLYPVRYMH